jgi:transmembrane sensor
MISNEEQVRAAIAEQAGKWFVANDEAPLNAQDSAALAAWLRTSPVHVEEFLAVSTIARGLKEARTDSEYSLEAILARARTAEDTRVQHIWPRVIESVRGGISGRWLSAAVAMAACAVLSLGLLLMWNVGPIQRPSTSDGVTALHFETRHGEQLTRHLADNSVVHLNTDSAVTVRYGRTERLVMLTSGQADFEVTHQPNRAFRVIAGSAEVVDLGTQFDVRLERDSTVVTVVEGRVAVGPSNSSQSHRFVQLSADQQIRVTAGQGPATPVAIDAHRTTAWLHRQIVFDKEPLERVAAEYNRYTSKPIEITTPALRSLQISGIFSTDDPEAFIAFLRSLKGVRVEETETRIRVW